MIPDFGGSRMASYLGTATCMLAASIWVAWHLPLSEVTDYSKKAFEDGTRAFEQLLGAKSFEQVVEIQSQYAK